MNNFTFNTDEFAERLEQAGLPKPQAEALANACLGWLNDNIATKDDLANLEQRLQVEVKHGQQLFEVKIAQSEQSLQAEIATVRAEIKHSEQRLQAEIKHSEQRLWIKMLIGQIALAGLMITALGVFFAALQY